jgi:hypothetical protein
MIGGFRNMGCKGGTKATPVEHSVTLSADDCVLRDGQSETLDHSFTSKTTDPWIGQITVKGMPDRQGIFFNGEKSDTFQVNPAVATDYLLRIFLKKTTQQPVQRPVEFRISDRRVLGNGAAVEVTTVWTLGNRSERGSFSVPFIVGS